MFKKSLPRIYFPNIALVTCMILYNINIYMYMYKQTYDRIAFRRPIHTHQDAIIDGNLLELSPKCM